MKMMKNLLKVACLAALATGLVMCTTKNAQSEEAAAKPAADSVKKVPFTNAKIVVLLAHPDMAKSQHNAVLAKAAESVEGVQVVNIYDYPVTADAYKEVIAHAKGIVFEFPFYWMSAPHLLKQWTDEVFTGFTGEKGMIEGKEFMVVTTTGSEEAAYQHNGRNRYTMEEYLRPYEGIANHTKMHWNKPLVAYGVPNDPEKDKADLQAYAEKYKQILTDLVKKVSEEKEPAE